ncbi:MAG: YlcI/YnfO family protein [Burkholderiales bacterium]
MKTDTVPPLRVSATLRRLAESVLQEGETLSAFMLESLTRGIESRKAQAAFIERGLASAARARKSGAYILLGDVIRKLHRRLGRARLRVR